MSKSDKKILILGGYGGINIGDELILSSILNDFRKEFQAENITVLSLDAEYTRKHHNVKSFYVGRWISGALITLRQLLLNDIVIIGGGGLIYDYGTSPNTIINYLIRALIAKILNKKIIFYAIGAGPIKLRLSRILIQSIMNYASLITTRDEESNLLLRSLGVIKPNIYTTADPVFALEVKAKKLLHFDEMQKKTSGDGPRIAICLLPFFKTTHQNHVNDLKFQRIFANIGIYLIRKYNAQIVFLPFEHQEDLEESTAVSKLMGDEKNVIVIKDKYSHSDVQEIVSRMDIIIGMRLHSLILAALQNIPSVAIVCNPKIQSFLKLTDQEEAGISLTELQEVELVNKIEFVMRNNEEIQKKIQHALTGLRANAHKNIELLIDVVQ